MSDKNKSIAEKRSELGELLAWFESDQFNVEEAIDKFTQAEKLASQIERELAEAKNTIIELKQRFDRDGEA